MKKLITMIMAFAGASLCFASGENAEDVLAKIETANQGVTTIEGSFSQVRVISAADRTLQMEGRLYFTAPDRMAMHYTVPENNLMVINGVRFFNRSGGRTLDVDTSKGGHLIGGLRNALLNCMHGKAKQVAEDNDADLSMSETAENYIITIKARKKVPSGYSRIVLAYRKGDCLLVSMQMDEPAGIRNTYLISGVTVNHSIDDTEYNIPKK